MRAYARWFGVTDPGQIDTWGIVGLLHDFDYEQNPTEDTHLHVGGRILRERGYPEEIVEAICSHADYMNIPRDTPLKKAIYACDEMVGFIGAVREGAALEADRRPARRVRGEEAQGQGVRALGGPVVRVRRARMAVGRPLAEHVAFLIDALRPIAAEIGL